MRPQIYFPILRAKAGEYGAMASLSEPTKALVCPVVDLPLPKAEQAFEQLQIDVVRSLAKSWGTAAPLFLDLSRYDPEEKTPQGVAYIERLFDSARQLGLKAAPVVGTVRDRYGVSGQYFRGVSRIMARDGRGVAIRLPHEDIGDPAQVKSAIDELEKILGATDGQCDLILDFGPLDRLPASRAKIVVFMEEKLQPTLEALRRRTFRSIIFSASSIPASLGKSADGVPVRIANAEYDVWSRLTGSGYHDRIRFSDYAARYGHQSDKPSKASAPARINLATPESHLLSVGSSTSYRELARKVTVEPEFHDQAGAWGKYAVRDAASGRDGIGNAAEWVARDTHMHIETMTAAIKKRLVEEGERFPAADKSAYIYDQAELGL